MEKYTIDIDKVLDEFEETEALKVHADKHHDESAIEHCLSTNGSAFEGKVTDNSWSESLLNSNLSLVEISDSVLDHKSDSGLPLQGETFMSSKSHLTSNFYCTLDAEKNLSTTNAVSGSFTKTEMQCNDDVNSKHLSYDIFYKPCESGSYSVGKSSDFSQSVNCSSKNLSQQYALNDCSPDEILCVSVREKNVDANSHESQVKDSPILSTESAAYSNDFDCTKSLVRTDGGTESDSLPVTKKSDLLDSKVTELENEEKSEKLCHPYQLTHLIDNQEGEFSSLSYNNNDKQSVTKDNGISKEDVRCSSLQTEHATLPSSKNDNFYAGHISGLNSHNEEKQIAGSVSVPPADQYINKTFKYVDNLQKLDNLEARNIQETEQVKQNALEDNFDLRNAVEVRMNNLNLENVFGIQDDDSGVSSTEDISGNSPPEIANAESVDSVVSEKCDLDDNFLKSKSLCSEIICSSNEYHTVENSVSSASSQQIDIDRNLYEKSNIGKNSFDITDTDLTVPASDVLVGAMPKLDNSNSDLSGHSCSENMSINVSEELKNDSEALNSVSDLVSSEEMNCDEETYNQKPESTVSLCVPEHDLESSSTSEMKEMMHENLVLNLSEENDGNDIDGIILDRQLEILDCAEDLLSLESKGEYISPRLQRPTTLDLPTLLIASPETSADLGNSSCNNEALPGVDVLPEASVVEPSVSEFVPSVKQQPPQIGVVKPYWIPDAEALNCMHCGMKFTVIKRRHHCRGCGKVLCSRCCNQKAFLSYLNKEDRICQPCADILASGIHNEQVPVAFDSQSSSSCGSSPNFSPSPQVPSSNFGDKSIWRPHPNNPDDYCSTIPPLQQIQSSESRPPPTVMVPIGVLKRGNKPRREPKQVIFSDGIRPGGDLTDLTEPVETVPVYRRIGRKRVDKIISGDSKLGSLSLSPHLKNRPKKVIVSDSDGPLPPIILQTGSENEDKIDWNQIFEKIQDDQQKAVSFALMKNMHIYVKLTKLDCCFGYECWCFTSLGLCTVGQDEIMVVLQRLPGEKNIPRDIFKFFTQVHDSASKGSTFEDLGHIIFPEQILGSSDHRGFLFVRPTFQCLSKLTVPNTPYLVAILIHKWEVPWAKVFPLRLMLRMGAECRYYPCALVSVRHRKPVYFEIGQTIMSVLADLRNYQFTIPVIPGLVVHMEEKKTCVNIPRNRYEKVMKILNSNNVEHVLALGSNFSTEADSHLVCMQKEEGDYQTQAINIENTTRRVTGASFIVFSGALKSTSGLSAKFSIVEDGLLIQIPQETMVNLHMALRDMRDLTVECGQINAAEPEEIVMIQWTRDDKKFNIGVRSPIDGRSFEGVPNLRIHTSTDYAGENYLIRWTEVFFLDVDDCGSTIQNELVDPCRLAETVAQSCCMALTPYLDQLADAELLKLGLRVTLDSQRDRVEYDIGSRGKALPALYMNALDNGLIPVILRLSGSTQSEKLSFELIFHILIK